LYDICGLRLPERVDRPKKPDLFKKWSNFLEEITKDHPQLKTVMEKP